MNKVLIFFLLLIFSINVFSRGKLEQSKDELKNESKPYDSSETRSGTYRSSSSYDDDDDDSFWAAYIVAGIWFVAVGSYDTEDHLDNLYTPYPYFDGNAGNYVERTSGRKSHTRFTIENNVYPPLMQHVFANRLKGKVNFRYLGFQADWLQMSENLDDESLAIFNLSLRYDRIRFERFNWGWNMGANFVGSGVNKFGFSFGLDAECFFLKPFSVYASAKWSQVNLRPLNQYEIRLKYYRKNYFFSGGFESIKVASPVYNYLTIGGGVSF